MSYPEDWDKLTIDEKMEWIEKFKKRRKLYLKRLRRLGVKIRNSPEEIKKVILAMDKLEKIKKSIHQKKNGEDSNKGE